LENSYQRPRSRPAPTGRGARRLTHTHRVGVRALGARQPLTTTAHANHSHVCSRASGLHGTTRFLAVSFKVMSRSSELPTIPPPFDVSRFAKDSDAKLAAAASSATEEREERVAESEMRLATRRPMGIAATDEEWAGTMKGSLAAAVPLDELKGMPIDHRAAYLLSWMDGTVDLETLAQASAMPREEVLRIVRDLYESGIVELR
jgi:hypothetical protein